MSDQALVGLRASMLADGPYGAVRERLLQEGLVYCTDTECAQLGFTMSEERGFFERPSKCLPLCDDTLVIPGLVHASVVLPLPMVVWKLLSHPGNLHWNVAPSKEG